ncbi:MAG: patatin-like phospholipase family protein [Acidobacteriota bacterium]
MELIRASRTLILPEMQGYRRTLGVVLSGGAAHCVVHIGCLRVLEREGIPVKAIAAASAGSIVGAAFAAGVAMEQMARIVRDLRWKDLFRIAPSRMGLLSSAPLERLLDSLLPVKRLEDLKIPLLAVATDLGTGKATVISRGEIVPAVRASCALPGLLPPSIRSDRLLVDGGVSANVPTQVLRRRGVDIIMVSDANQGLTRFARPTNLFEVIVQSIYITTRKAVTPYIEAADLIVAPEIGQIGWQDLSRADEMLRAGEAAMERKLAELRALMMERRVIRRMVGKLARGQARRSSNDR